MKHLLLGSLLLAPVLTLACGVEHLKFENAYAHPTAHGVKNAEAYLSIHNTCHEPIDITSIKTSAAAKAEFHDAQMNTVSPLTIPANGTVNLAPGGTHVMLIDLTKQLHVRTSFPLHFVLKDGKSSMVMVSVKD